MAINKANKGSAGRSVKADLLGRRVDPVDGKLVTLDDLRQKYPQNDKCILVELHMYQIEDYWRDVCAEITIFQSTPKCMTAGFLKQAGMDSAPQARPVVMPRQSPSPQLGDVARPFASFNHSSEMKWKTGLCYVPRQMSATAKVTKVPANSAEFAAKVTKVPANSAESFPEFVMGA